MQEFKMSLPELDEKFTKSEMAIMSYSSIEQSDNLEESVKRPTRNRRSQLDSLKEEFGERETVMEEPNEHLPSHFYNEEGEIDLRQVKGKEAFKFLQSQGLTFFPIFKDKG